MANHNLKGNLMIKTGPCEHGQIIVRILSSISRYLLIPDYVKTCIDKRNKVT